jgi:outer membrane biogenesis lipoprotein LolB
MKKILIPATMVASLLAVAVLPSCKKDESDPTRAEQIVGTWKNTEEGSDVNNNNTWDPSERTAVPAADQGTFKFNSDGTGQTSGNFGGAPITIDFKWNLQNSENDIRLITSFLGTSDTSVQNIVSFNGTDAVLKDASANPDEYIALKKQ